MTIQHKDITGANVHEPKGVDVAAAKLVYVSNGSGSGTWKRIGTDNLLGLTTDGGLTGRKLITDGAEGFTLAYDNLYGSMVMTNNTTAFTVAAASDATLNTTSDYAIITGTGAPWAASNLDSITFNTDRLTSPINGIYSLEITLGISAFSFNSGIVAARYLINGSTFGSRKIEAQVDKAAHRDTITIMEHIQIPANQYLQVAIASTVAGTVMISNAAVNLKLLRQLS